VTPGGSQSSRLQKINRVSIIVLRSGRILASSATKKQRIYSQCISYLENITSFAKMEFKVWKTRVILIFFLSVCVTISVAWFSGETEVKHTDTSVFLPSVPISQAQVTNTKFQLGQNQRKNSRNVVNSPLSSITSARLNYRPKYEITWAHPVNYGERYQQDIYGRPVYNQPIIVLHETVYSAASAINHFQTPHPNEDEQASYHALIKLDGTVVYLVPPEKRAFGAANSIFESPNGLETVKTHPKLSPSVNNFAYHVSLETPLDGRNHNISHSGYTDAQYQSLAWLLVQSRVPDARITTHKAVDRSGNRIDPRSFDTKKFLNLLHSYRHQLSKEPVALLN
jgi:N-acetyl-anhydromuramyl-L-alanine amidase AmpD